jgi:hypothetical protein
MRRIPAGSDQLDMFTDYDKPYTRDRFVTGSIPLPVIEHESAIMRRPFVSWDGEGYTDDMGQHHYWLLANSLGDRIIAPPGRSLERTSVARLMQTTLRNNPGCIHTGFSLNYDFTMILRSYTLTDDQARKLRSTNQLVDSGYFWKVRNGKELALCEYGERRESKTFTLYDTWPYFQCSFVKALNAYFGETWPDTTSDQRSFIIASKENRQNFDRDHDAEIIEYNDHELRLMVCLMNELRERAYNAGLPLTTAWYGPGAFSSALMNKHKIKDNMGPDLYSRTDLAEAIMCAYAGGRFELPQCGHVNGPMYQADRNSAYPHAIRLLPCLAHGEWKHDYWSDDNSSAERFGVYRVRFTTDLDKPEYAHHRRNVPFPLWRRDPHGNISFPVMGVHGWYHASEVKAALNWCKTDYARSVNARMQIVESWTWEQSCDETPFAWVAELYRQRQTLKRLGSGAHVALKLALNSMYGKLAQQIGWATSKNGRPPFHQLVWAGAITADCRAAMLDAASQNLDSVIAFETDGIFTTAPLDLPVSTELGDWEVTTYDDGWYFQSGMRYGIRDGVTVSPATRGIPASDISLERIRETVVDCESVVGLAQTRFYGIRWAMHRNRPDLIGQWETAPRAMRMMQEDPRGKRVHDPDCPACVTRNGKRIYTWDRLHLTIPAQGWEGTLSQPHPIEWVRGDDRFAQRRELDNEDDGEQDALW